jgi:hypothetical protein
MWLVGHRAKSNLVFAKDFANSIRILQPPETQMFDCKNLTSKPKPINIFLFRLHNSIRWRKFHSIRNSFDQFIKRHFRNQCEWCCSLISSISAFMLKISPNAFDASSTIVARQSSINAANKRLQHLWAQKHFQSKALLCPAIIFRSVDFPAPFYPSSNYHHQ